MTTRRTRGEGPAGGRSLRAAGLGAAAGRIVPIAVPALFLGGYIIFAATHVKAADAFFDFHAFWRAGHAVAHGHTPYPPARASVLAHENSFVYPAPAAIVMVPLGLLPFKVAAPIFATLLVLSIPLALRIVGVRDWRCYALALLSQPVANAIANAAVSPFLAVGLALVWRYRDRRIPAAVTVAALIVLKVFLWPLVLWLLFTRRARTAILACALSIGSSLIAWAAIGFDGFRAYPHLLSVLTRLLEGKSYSVVSLGISAGLGVTAARALAVLAGALALAAVAIHARRPGTDAWTFIVVTGAALVLSPIVWLHYFVLLYIPIAIARPRLSWLWAVPLPLWVLRAQSTRPPIWRKDVKITDLALTPRVGDWTLVAIAVGIGAAVTVLAAWATRPSRLPATTG